MQHIQTQAQQKQRKAKSAILFKKEQIQITKKPKQILSVREGGISRQRLPGQSKQKQSKQKQSVAEAEKTSKVPPPGS